MYHICFIHFSVDGHVACVHVLAVVHSVAVSVGVHVLAVVHSAAVSVGVHVSFFEGIWRDLGD